MKNIQKQLIFILVSFFPLAVVAQSSDLLISPITANGATSLNIDFINDNNATSMQFDISMKGLNKKKIDFRNCVSGLPPTHQGGCNIVGENLRVLIYSMTNEAIPSGFIGEINLNININEMLSNKSNTEITSINVEGMKLAAPNGKVPKGMVYVEPLNNENSRFQEQ